MVLSHSDIFRTDIVGRIQASTILFDSLICIFLQQFVYDETVLHLLKQYKFGEKH